jgi:integrase
MKLKTISPNTITDMFTKFELQPATCKKLYTILQSVFSYAVDSRLIKESPCCSGVILPKKQYDAEQRKPFLSDVQAKELIKMLDNTGYSEFATIIKVLLYTGMRSGECLALQWEDIDFVNCLIHIRHNLADVGGKHWLDTPKTKNSIRTIGLSDKLKEILLNHKEMQSEKIKAVGSGYKYPNLLFTSKTGDFKDRSQLNTEFKRFIKNTEFSDISLHKLRHANATLLINAGVDLKLVSENLGHSDVAVTANIYAEVLESSKKKMADLVALNLG